ERLQVVRHELLPDLRGEAAAVDRAAGGVPDRLTTAGADPRGRRDLRRVADHPGLRVLARLRITLVVLVRTGLARALVRRRAGQVGLRQYALQRLGDVARDGAVGLLVGVERGFALLCGRRRLVEQHLAVGRLELRHEVGVALDAVGGERGVGASHVRRRDLGLTTADGDVAVEAAH